MKYCTEKEWAAALPKAERVDVIGGCVLILANCLDVLESIGQVNCIVSDVPYKLTSGGNTTGGMRGKFSKERYDNSGEIIPCDIGFEDFMPELSRCMDRGHAYFMVNNRHVVDMGVAAQAAGFRFHNWLFWDKTTATPNRWYMKNGEFTFFGFKGKATTINDCGSKQLIKVKNVLNGLHETEKPVELMEHYIRNSTKIGDIVLDPFMGSGTTGVAAANLGRKFIGIEIDQAYFDIACERVRNETKQHDMFPCLGTAG